MISPPWYIQHACKKGLGTLFLVAILAGTQTWVYTNSPYCLPGLKPWSTDLIICSALRCTTWTPVALYGEVTLVFDITIHKRKPHRCPLPGLEPWSKDLIACSSLHCATWTPTVMCWKVTLVCDIIIHVEIRWHHSTLPPSSVRMTHNSVPCTTISLVFDYMTIQVM